MERELIPNFGIRAGYVYREIDQYWQRLNGNRAFGDFNIPTQVQDPGPDGSLGTGDDGGFIQAWDLDPNVLALGGNNTTTNIRGTPNFQTYEVSGTKRMADGWSLITGFSVRLLKDHEDSYLGNRIRTRDPGGLENPNQCINTGNSDCTYDFKTWTAKVSATWQGPVGLIISPNLRHQGGQPFGRLFRPTLNYGRQRILAEPMDTNRQDHLTIFDVRTEKAFTMGPNGGGRLIGFFDLYNIANYNGAENINWNSSSTYLRPIEIVAPRMVRIGVKFEF